MEGQDRAFDAEPEAARATPSSRRPDGGGVALPPGVSNAAVARALGGHSAGSEEGTEQLARRVFPDWPAEATPAAPADNGTGKPSRSGLPASVVGQAAPAWRPLLGTIGVHDGADAALNRLSANAATRGTDVYVPGGVAGASGPGERRLLAHEVAHAVQSGAGLTGANAVGLWSRDQPSETANYQRYCTYFAAEIGDGIGAAIGRFELASPSPHLHWTSGAQPLAEAVDMALPRGPEMLKALDRLLGAVDAAARIIDRTRVHTQQAMAPESKPDDISMWELSTGPLVWYPDVATGLADVLIVRLRESLARMVPRYLDVRSRAQLAAWEQAARTDPALAPEPDAGALLVSHPIDVLAADVLTSGRAVRVDLDAYRASGPAPAAAALRPVKLSYPASEGLTYWVRVEQPLDATREEVALALYGTTEMAYQLMAAGRLFGFPWSGQLLPARQEELRKAAPPGATPVGQPGATTPSGSPDPVRELLASPAAGEAALAQARDRAPFGPVAPAAPLHVLVTMNNSELLLDSVAKQAKRFGAQREVELARADLTARRRRLAAGDAAGIQEWTLQAEGQESLLGEVSDGFVHLVALLDKAAEKADPFALNLPDYYRQAFRDVAEGLAGAAGASLLVATAQERLAAAQLALKLLPVTVMEGILHGLQATIGGLGGRQGASSLGAREEALRGRMIELRTLAATDPQAFGQSLEEVFGLVSDLQTEVSIDSGLDNVEQMWKALADSDGFWSRLTASINDVIEIAQLKAEAQHWKDLWVDAKTRWESGDRQAVKGDIEGLAADPRQKEWLHRVAEAIHDAQIRAFIGQMIAMVALMLVTSGVGALARGVVGGLEIGSTAAFWTVQTVEAATFTAGNAIMFSDEVTAGGLAGDFAFNLFLFGTMSKLAARMERTAWAAAGGLKALAAEHGVPMLVMGASELAKQEVKALWESRGKKGLSAAEVEEIAGQSFVSYVAMTLIARGKVMKRFTDWAAGKGGKLGQAAGRALEARREAIALAELARTSRRQEDLDGGLRRDNEATQAEQEVYNALNERLAREPHLLEDLGIPLAEIQQRLTGPEAVQLRQAELAGLMRQLDSGHFEVPRSQMPRLLEAMQSQGARVKPGDIDVITGRRLYTVTPDGGEPMTLIEGLDARPGGIGEAAPTPEQAAAARREVSAALERLAVRDTAVQKLIDGMQHIQVDVLTLGGGPAGIIASATTPSARGMRSAPGVEVTEVPKVLNITAGEVEPWRARAEQLLASGGLQQGRIGQPPGEWGSAGLTRQPQEFTSDATGFGRAEDIADALTMTAYESGVVSYRGTQMRVEANPGDGSWPHDTPFRVLVRSNTTGEPKYFYARKGLNLATGPGPATRLESHGPQAKVTPEHENVLVDTGRLVYGDAIFSAPVRGKVVLVSGGGATAGWAAWTAAHSGASKVIWLGRPATPRAGEPLPPIPPEVVALGERLGYGNLPPGEAEAALRELMAFKNAVLARNTDLFLDPRVERRVAAIQEVAPAEQAGGSTQKVRVRFAGGTAEGEVFDIVGISHGQDAAGQAHRMAGPPGLVAVLQGTPVRLKMIIREGRLVGLRGEAPADFIQVPAGSMTAELGEFVAEKDLYLKLLKEQAADARVPEHSRGVPGSLNRIGQTVPGLNTRVPEPGRGAATPGDRDRDRTPAR
ncbi:eCIS core domain-containing protein [Actinoplanes sp. CA-142083]|uniref:eCIS core domain-containing protein n=1 Tax=Actinoplanes sp. CA-142083 TaxID=3239903 RepID=UPI003D8D9559